MGPVAGGGGDTVGGGSSMGPVAGGGMGPAPGGGSSMGPVAGGGGMGPAFPGGGSGIPPGGGIGGPPGGDIGGGLGGENTPPLHTNLNHTFFTLAFDAEKNEVYTVGERVSGGRMFGTLRRFSYPSFQIQGTYKLPNLGTRAVIDPKKGVMYMVAVTPTINANVMRGQQYDRAAANGTLQVYDLEQIRSGKVQEQKDLLPTTTLEVSGRIEGLVLSADGKTLYCVKTLMVGTKPAKAELYAFDTADLKDKPKKMELDMPAADLCLSADGKDLLVLGEVTDPKNPNNVTVVDAAEWKLKPTLTLPGPSKSIAPAKDGGFVAGAYMGGAGGGSTKLMLAGTQTDNGELKADSPAKASNNGYVKFTPDGGRLISSSFKNYGFDVYDVTGKSLKKVASVRQAGGLQVGGYFHVSPDGKFLVFHFGAVIEMAKVGENTGFGNRPPGGFNPGAPGGGFNPGGGLAPPGGGPGGGLAPPGGGGFVPPGGAPGGPGGGLAPPGGPGGGLAPPGGGGFVPPGGFNPGGAAPGGGSGRPGSGISGPGVGPPPGAGGAPGMPPGLPPGGPGVPPGM
jgi:hypothetical protein